MAAATVAVASSAGGRVAPPTGDPGGLALLARVHRAYVAVPGVTLAGRTGSLSFRYTLALRSGIVVGEQVVVVAPNGMTNVVARRGTSTFARDPGRSCWQRIAASSNRSIANIGLPFPDQPQMQVKAPRRTRTGWLLSAVADGVPGTFAIDGGSTLIRSLTITTQGIRIVEHAHTLASRPTLAVPQPRC